MPGTTQGGPPRLLDRVREAIRLRRYSPRTEEAYVAWVRRFIVFNGKRHPLDLGPAHVSAFLSSLAARDVSASTQNQALSAIVFLYQVVLGRDLPWLADVVRARRPVRLPVVLSRAEVADVLRVKDLDFHRLEVTVRDPKGGRDRVTMLPASLAEPLAAHLARVKVQHESDVWAGRGSVALPGALREKYPKAGAEWPWQWVFPATRQYRDAATGEWRRHHLHESVLQRALKDAVRAAGIGHRDVSTTMVYTHVLNRGWRAVRSPLDQSVGPKPSAD